MCTLTHEPLLHQFNMMTMTMNLNTSSGSSEETATSTLEKDYYGCFCLKFIVKNGTHITEEKVIEDFGTYGDVVDVRGPGLFSGLRGNHVYVRFIEKRVAELALKELAGKYHQLTPASISDVLPDNYGLYTISFYNKTGIPSLEVRREFSKFGEVKNLTGSLDVKGGRVFVSYKNKESAVHALQAFFFRKDRYPNMKFALPRCEKDYFGCFCLKFYNKTGEVTYEKVFEDFSQYGEVVDIRGPGLFDVTGDDVYVRYKVQSSAEQALIELVGKYDSLCLAPPSDIQADKFGYYTITFVNDKCLSKSDVWYIFSKFGTVACVNGTFDCKKGRVFVSYKEKQGALNALETMLITKEYHLQVSKNSTVRKNDYNVGSNSGKPDDGNEFNSDARHERAGSEQKVLRDRSTSREASCGPPIPRHTGPPPMPRSAHMPPPPIEGHSDMSAPPPSMLPSRIMPSSAALVPDNGKNGLVKFNRNVEMDIFGYYCLSFLNEDGEISEKKVRTDFSKFGEVVSVRGALGKQKGHVFVRFRKKEAAENCLNCLNSFPLSEMSELFGPYLYLSPATPRDIDCDMYGLYSISFLNLNLKSFPNIRAEFAKFGEIVRLTSGGGGNTDELVTISYADKGAAINALKTHFTNKDYPYLDIAKGSSLLLVNSSDSSDCEENEPPRFHHHHQELQNRLQKQQQQVQQLVANAGHAPRHHSGSRPHSTERPHDPFSNNSVAGSDVVDELLKPLQSYFSVFRTGVYDQGGEVGDLMNGRDGGPPAHNTRSQTDKRYKIKKNQGSTNSANEPRKGRHDIVENGIGMHPPQALPHHQGPPPMKAGAIPQQVIHTIANQMMPNSAVACHPSLNHNMAAGHIPGQMMPTNVTSSVSAGGMVAPPPPITNGFSQSMMENMETELVQVPAGPPNLNEPPPPLMVDNNGHYQQHTRSSAAMMMINQMSGPPPQTSGAMMSPPGPGGRLPMFSTPNKDESSMAPPTPQHQHVSDSHQQQLTEQLESDISNLSIQDEATSRKEEKPQPEIDIKSQANVEQPSATSKKCLAGGAPPPDQPEPVTHVAKQLVTSITKDIFNVYSVAFTCKSKDLSERRVKLDFSLVAEVSRVRGQLGRPDSVIIVSFEKEEDALSCFRHETVISKYPDLRPAPEISILPDKDGYFSIEFINTGMSGVREITNEFSKHGELAKVHQGGAKNAVKRVTVSYTDIESAFRALEAYANNKDVRGIDFVSECLSFNL